MIKIRISVFAGLMAGGGFLLLCFPPTSAAGSTAIALSVKAIGGALMSGGMAGDFKNFIRISWTKKER